MRLRVQKQVATNPTTHFFFPSTLNSQTSLQHDVFHMGEATTAQSGCSTTSWIRLFLPSNRNKIILSKAFLHSPLIPLCKNQFPLFFFFYLLFRSLKLFSYQSDGPSVFIFLAMVHAAKSFFLEMLVTYPDLSPSSLP